MPIELSIPFYFAKLTEIVGWSASGAFAVLTLAHVLLLVLRALKARRAYNSLAGAISTITAPLR